MRERVSELRMVIELLDPPLPPDLPAHVAVRRFRPQRDDQAVYDAHQEIFGDDLAGRAELPASPAESD
jgi:hypothetical protein